MFSDKFTQLSRYSLERKEYIDTISLMPPKCTGLYDDKYLPNDLDPVISDKHVSLFNYDYLTYDVSKRVEELDLFGIIHKDGDIIGYKNVINLQVKNLAPLMAWKNFCFLAKVTELEPCHEKMYYISPLKGELSALISEIDYDKHGNALRLYFYDRDLDTSKLPDSLTSLINYSESNSSYAKGHVGISPNDNTYVYKLSLEFPELNTRIKGLQAPHTEQEQKLYVRKIATNYNCKFTTERIPPFETVDQHCANLNKYGYLTIEEIKWFTKPEVTGLDIFKDAKFDIEFIIDENGSIVDRIVCVYEYEHFKQRAKWDDLTE